MKKVRSPKDIKVASGRSAIRTTSPFVGRLGKPLNPGALKLKQSNIPGGNTLNDYLLDLMKLK